MRNIVRKNHNTVLTQESRCTLIRPAARPLAFEFLRRRQCHDKYMLAYHRILSCDHRLSADVVTQTLEFSRHHYQHEVDSHRFTHSTNAVHCRPSPCEKCPHRKCAHKQAAARCVLLLPFRHFQGSLLR